MKRSLRVCTATLFSFLIITAEAVLTYDPQINYFDGTSYTDNCRSKLERRVSGLSGLLISHQLYGTLPYNASKNCFLLITAPVGYRIRLRVLDFNVLGDPQNCDKDTLHVFDHEKAIDPSTLHDATPEDTSPGPIVGQFCGIIRNASELAISSENALTLWWHSDADLPPNHSGEGFRLLWSAFRKSNSEPCNTQREFTCANHECIPSELACNRYPDCKDESDLSRERQIAHRCDFLDDDPLGSLTGLTLLLMCMAVVSCCGCLCVCACVCCKCMKRTEKSCRHTTTSQARTNGAHQRLPCCAAAGFSAELSEPMVTNSNESKGAAAAAAAINQRLIQQPTPPAFYPPSPPKQTPSVGNTTATATSAQAAATYSPQRTRLSSGLSVGCVGGGNGTNAFPTAQQIRYNKQALPQYPQALILSSDYGTPAEHANLCTNTDYTYPRNEARHLLI